MSCLATTLHKTRDLMHLELALEVYSKLSSVKDNNEDDLVAQL